MSLRVIKTISVLVLLYLAGCGAVRAVECTTRAGAADFGSSDSYSVYSSMLTTTASAGFSCSGSTLTIVTTNYIQVTLTSSVNGTGTQPRMHAGGYYIPYTVYATSDYSNPLTVGSSYQWAISSLVGLLGLFNSSDGTLPLYLATSTGSNVPAGTYSDTLTLTWFYTLCNIGLGACIQANSETLTNTLPVTLIVSDVCAVVDAPDVNFGTAALPSAFSTVSAALQVRCTLASAFAINLSSNNEDDDWRVMTGTGTANAGYTLQYQIYKSDGTAWNSSSNLSGTGTGLAQTINYNAAVNASQNNKPSGSYGDTITITVSY